MTSSSTTIVVSALAAIIAADTRKPLGTLSGAVVVHGEGTHGTWGGAVAVKEAK